MDFEYMQYPTTVKSLADEIMRTCDAYKEKTIGNTEIKEIIHHYANTAATLFFTANELNPTVSILLGKKRRELVLKLLDGFRGPAIPPE